MLPVIIGGIAGMLATVCSTARDMYRDNLINQRELAAIEAKLQAFKELMSYKKYTAELAFQLEMKFMDHKDRLLGNISALLERFDRAADIYHLEFYADRIRHMQDTYSLILTGDPKYFNNRLINSSDNMMPEFSTRTQIEHVEEKDTLKDKTERFLIQKYEHNF